MEEVIYKHKTISFRHTDFCTKEHDNLTHISAKNGKNANLAFIDLVGTLVA